MQFSNIPTSPVVFEPITIEELMEAIKMAKRAAEKPKEWEFLHTSYGILHPIKPSLIYNAAS